MRERCARGAVEIQYERDVMCTFLYTNAVFSQVRNVAFDKILILFNNHYEKGRFPEVKKAI